jgi:hypothetical protein
LVLPAGGGQKRVDTAAKPFLVLVVAKGRHDLVFDDAFGDRIRNGALQPVAHFDPQGALLEKCGEQHAIIGVLLADAPVGEDRGHVIFQDGSLRQSRKDGYDDLRRSIAFELGQSAF